MRGKNPEYYRAQLELLSDIAIKAEDEDSDSLRYRVEAELLGE